MKVAGVLLLIFAMPVVGQTVSAVNGQAIFESRCMACHSLDVNRVGPALGSVLGRTAGKSPGFEYSKALASATHVWNRDKLLGWLENPEAVVPGQGMGYRVELSADRLDVVAYLASLSVKDVSK
jgi:cytochrome c